MSEKCGFKLHDTIAALDRTPRVLRVLMTGATAAMIDRDYGPGTWSAREVVAHLIFGEQTDWMPRLEIIMQYGVSRPLDAFDRAGHRPLLNKSLDELLDSFDAHRRDSLAALRDRNLSEADLARAGRHPALGVVTVSQLLATWVVHDLNHVAQVCKAMAWQSREATGPWEQYLSILGPPRPR